MIARRHAKNDLGVAERLRRNPKRSSLTLALVV
jgi:hypothetical protein